MIRSTLRDAARRIQTFASRATMREMDLEYKDDYWPRIKQMDVMHSESPTGVEWVQSYGNVSIPAKQDKDDQKQQQGKQQSQSGGNGAGGSGNQKGEQGEQPKGDAAEPIVMYLNGSRSHPMVMAVGDRRHQLMLKGEGDVGQYRLQEDKQQFLMLKEGNYVTTRNDKKLRMALVPKDDGGQDQQQQQQGGQQQKKQKKYGQESTQKDNDKSEVAIEQNGETTYSQHGEAYSSQKGGSDSTTHWKKDKKISTQVTEEHTHLRYEDKAWLWNNKEGNFMFPPLLVKKDTFCKEG